MLPTRWARVRCASGQLVATSFLVGAFNVGDVRPNPPTSRALEIQTRWNEVATSILVVTQNGQIVRFPCPARRALEAEAILERRATLFSVVTADGLAFGLALPSDGTGVGVATRQPVTTK